jgi:hypothetical protein
MQICSAGGVLDQRRDCLRFRKLFRNRRPHNHLGAAAHLDVVEGEVEAPRSQRNLLPCLYRCGILRAFPWAGPEHPRALMPSVHRGQPGSDLGGVAGGRCARSQGLKEAPGPPAR